MCATSADKKIVPTRSATTYLNSSASAGTAIASTNSCPSSTPTLNATSDVARCEPANCSDSPQDEREPESVHEPERERDDPPPLELRADDVLERHVHDRQRDQHFDQRRKPQRVRRQSVADAISVIECATVNDVTIAISGRSLRNGITRQNTNSRWSMPIENVLEPERHEAERRLVPARVQPHEPRIAEVFERALCIVRQDESQDRRGPNAQVRERWPDREPRRGRRDRIFDQHVEHRLLPRQIHRIGQRRRPARSRARICTIVNDRSDGSDNRAAVTCATLERPVVLVHLDVVGDPELAGVSELRRYARDVEVARRLEARARSREWTPTARAR